MEKKLHAISLLEVMISVAIVGILASISFKYVSSLRAETARKEAHSELLKIKSMIDQLAIAGNFIDSAGNSINVSNIMDVATEILNGRIPLPILTNYSLNISVTKPPENPSIGFYKLTATVIPGTMAASATTSTCNIIELEVTINNEERRTPTACW